MPTLLAINQTPAPADEVAPADPDDLFDFGPPAGSHTPTPAAPKSLDPALFEQWPPDKWLDMTPSQKQKWRPQPLTGWPLRIATSKAACCLDEPDLFPDLFSRQFHFPGRKKLNPAEQHWCDLNDLAQETLRSTPGTDMRVGKLVRDPSLPKRDLWAQVHEQLICQNIRTWHQRSGVTHDDMRSAINEVMVSQINLDRDKVLDALFDHNSKTVHSQLMKLMWTRAKNACNDEAKQIWSRGGPTRVGRSRHLSIEEMTQQTVSYTEFTDPYLAIPASVDRDEEETTVEDPATSQLIASAVDPSSKLPGYDHRLSEDVRAQEAVCHNYLRRAGVRVSDTDRRRIIDILSTYEEVGYEAGQRKEMKTDGTHQCKEEILRQRFKTPRDKALCQLLTGKQANGRNEPRQIGLLQMFLSMHRLQPLTSQQRDFVREMAKRADLAVTSLPDDPDPDLIGPSVPARIRA